MEREFDFFREEQTEKRGVKRKKARAAKGSIDMPFLLLTLLLTAIGLVMLFSASFPSALYESGDATYYVKKQAFFAVVGCAAMLFIGSLNYQRFRGTAKLLMGLSFFLLILVIIPGVGITVNNATRWLGIEGVFTFQPSEIAKLAVIVYFADSISKRKESGGGVRYRQRHFLRTGISGRHGTLHDLRIIKNN